MNTLASSIDSKIAEAIKEYYRLRKIDTDWDPLSIQSSVMTSYDKQKKVIINLFKDKHNKNCWIIDEIVGNYIDGIYWYNISADKDKFINSLIISIDSKINTKCT